MSFIFSWLYGKAKGYLALAGALVLAVGYAFVRGRAAGVKHSTDSIAKETQRVNEKFRHVDEQRPDFDAAVDSLRKRASKGGTKK